MKKKWWCVGMRFVMQKAKKSPFYFKFLIVFSDCPNINKQISEGINTDTSTLTDAPPLFTKEILNKKKNSIQIPLLYFFQILAEGGYL